MIITLQLSMSIATMEEDIVGISVRLNQAMTPMRQCAMNFYIVIQY